MTAEIIAKALSRSSTGGDWMARWPAHDYGEPSLSIRGEVKKSTWWQGIRFPDPVKLDPNTAAWRVEDFRALIERNGR